MSNKVSNGYKLRPRERVNIFDRYQLEEGDFDNSAEEE